MRIFWYCVLFVILFGGRPLNVYAAEELRALWVECEGDNDTLSSRKKIDAMISEAGEANINTLFVQVYRGNRSWYNSGVADNTPYLTVKKKEGIDILAYIIEEAHRKGIEVHAWLNIFRIAQNLKAPMLKSLGEDIINVDSRGHSLLEYKNFKVPGAEGEYFTLGTHGYWLDPGNLNVQEYLLNIITEVLTRYPSVDGIHMDMIRNPYCVPYSPGSRFPGAPSFGYGKESVRRFKEETGLNPFNMDLNTKNTQAWDNFRRDQVSNFVKKVYALCLKTNPKVKVSAAVLSWADRAYLSAFQDWRRWLEDKIVDAVLVMNYSKDTRFARYLTRQAVSSGLGRHVYIGLGAYFLFNEPEELLKQVEDTREIKAQGVALFSYDSLRKDKMFAFVKKQLFPGKASLPKMEWKK